MSALPISVLSRACPRLSAAADAALACLAPGDRERSDLIRHAAWERLLLPEAFVSFPVPWMDDRGQVRLSLGFCAVLSSAGEGDVLFRAGVTADDVLTLGFLRRLRSALTGRGPGAVCALDADPGPLSDGESMRLCRGLLDGLHRAAPELAGHLRGDGLPEREAGYLPVIARETSPLSRAEAAGQGLSLFAREVLALAGERPEGLTAARTGRGPLADAAADAASRLGFRTVSEGAAEVLFLCDPAKPLRASDAPVLLRRGVRAVFEGAPCACTPRAAERLRAGGVLFVPAIAAGAGGDLPLAGLSSWDASRQLRRQMRRILRETLSAGGGDPYRGAYAAAILTAAEALVRRGIV